MDEPKISAKRIAEAIIKERMPMNYDGQAVIKLKHGYGLMLKPKFTFIDKYSRRVPVRYAQDFNSIFVEDQDDTEPVKLSLIKLHKSKLITDKVLLSYLLLHPDFGTRFELIDPLGEAKKELERLEVFDDVWDKVRSSELHVLRGLAILLTTIDVSTISQMLAPELKMFLRKVAQKDPLSVQDALKDPILKPLYAYHVAVALGVVKYFPKRGGIYWVDSDTEICQVPVSEDPGVYFARMLLTSDFAKVKEMLEHKINSSD